MSNQNWDELKRFLAPSRTAPFSAATKQLGTKHTTVARHIQALEDELNNRLFQKSVDEPCLRRAADHCR
jgi:DNA-binding transcriptional LysR family regulator